MIGCRPLTDTEIDQLKARADLDIRTRCLLILGATTGFRISELLSLKVQDIGPTHVYLHKRSSKGKQRGRNALLTPEAKGAIEALLYHDRLQPTDFLFKSRRSAKALDRHQAHRLLHEAYKSLNLQGKVASHSMRKYFAHAVYKGSGKDIVVTQKALGHRLVSTTGDYLAPQKETVDRIIMGLRKV